MTIFTIDNQIENLEKAIAADSDQLNVLHRSILSAQSEHAKLLAEKAKEARKASLENSPKARWDRAVKSLRKNGVHFRTNMMKCCRGCITEEDLNMKDEAQPYGYTYGGQDMWVKFNEDGQPYKKADRWGRRSNGYDYKTPEKVFINHGNNAGNKIAAEFRAEGFKVEWDGQEYSCVEVIF